MPRRNVTLAVLVALVMVMGLVPGLVAQNVLASDVPHGDRTGEKLSPLEMLTASDTLEDAVSAMSTAAFYDTVINVTEMDGVVDGVYIGGDVMKYYTFPEFAFGSATLREQIAYEQSLAWPDVFVVEDGYLASIRDIIDADGFANAKKPFEPGDLAEEYTDTSGLPVNPPMPEEPEEELTVHFIDVGQGDAILIEAPGAVVLIDGGPRTAGEIVVQYLVDRGIREPGEPIDLVIATHPHADHIGGLIEVLQTFPVYRIIDSGIPHTTITYDDYLSEVEKQVDAGHCVFETPEGQEIDLGGNATLTVLGPEEDLSSLNDNSVVCRLDFGQTSFLFTGDAEEAAEQHLLGLGVQLAADVLKVGHHGSRTSTTAVFLEAVSPQYAVICVGEGNVYGHPHEEVLSRLDGTDVEVFRTDLQGTIVFTSDGTTLTPDESPWEYEPLRVNINTASHEELQQIIHIGPERADEIIELRPFESLDGLLDVSGIGPSRLQDIKDQGIAYVE